MDNKTISRTFRLCGQLMELHGQNSFRTKAMMNASFKIDKLPFAAAESSLDVLSTQPGIGKSTAEKILQVANAGTFPELEKLLSQTPEGILEILKIKGLGPKKVQVIWKELEIESVGELYYACNENRLIEAKGFGVKTQEDIKKAIEFAQAQQGWFLYARVLSNAEAIYNHLKNHLKTELSFTGAFRRKCEILERVELIATASLSDISEAVEALNYEWGVEEKGDSLEFLDENACPFVIYSSSAETFGSDLLMTTGSTSHIQQLRAIKTPIPIGNSEEEIYRSLGLEYIEPELREGLDEVELAKTGQLPDLITYVDLKGSLHNHSTYSDGVHSLAEMARYCKEELGLEYFGICDHSKTAVYAGGMTVEKLEAQWAEIDQLNEQLAPFRIFKGIESDILNDGSLDYDDDILSRFDFVVASIHSVLKMDEERATNRLIKAIENPYTTILGHPTGRLLLSRAGYPLDFKKMIDACAANAVAIEINANPLRLDLDWRWHRYALEKGVILSINPDAHRTEGLLDMCFGVHVARKGGVHRDKCLNAFSLPEITAFFESRRANSN